MKLTCLCCFASTPINAQTGAYSTFSLLRPSSCPFLHFLLFFSLPPLNMPLLPYFQIPRNGSLTLSVNSSSRHASWLSVLDQISSSPWVWSLLPQGCLYLVGASVLAPDRFWCQKTATLLQRTHSSQSSYWLLRVTMGLLRSCCRSPLCATP